MQGFNTIEPADSVEFCPHPEATNILVCGTYKLNERTTSKDHAVPLRQGRCLVFRVEDEDTGQPSLQHIQAVNFPAIPDMKWHHTISSNNPILGVADSEGNISILQWHLQELTVKKLDSIRCVNEDILCLSLDWSNRRIPQHDLSNLVVSLSDGSLCLLRSAGNGELLKTDEWLAHEYEAWIATWDCWETNIIYSGGDDLALKFWDVRQGFDRPFFTNRRFEAGVTTIQNHPYVEHLIAVGSYNNSIYLFDRRKATAALSEVPVGGGAWRVKWNPHYDRKGDLLVACMQDGFKILRYDSGMHSGQIVHRFDAHASLAYGVDWSYHHPTTSGRQIIGSCSFYDHLLHVWKA